MTFLIFSKKIARIYNIGLEWREFFVWPDFNFGPGDGSKVFCKLRHFEPEKAIKNLNFFFITTSLHYPLPLVGTSRLCAFVAFSIFIKFSNFIWYWPLFRPPRTLSPLYLVVLPKFKNIHFRPLWAKNCQNTPWIWKSLINIFGYGHMMYSISYHKFLL